MKISTPCNETYDAMPPTSGGRFCASCEKVVIDFTAMNTEEIKRYFENTTAKEVCGRFKSPQIGEGTKVEKMIWKLKERIQTRVSFVPARVVFISILTGLSAFMSSCMGKVVENYPNEEPKPGSEQTEKLNIQHKTDSIKETPEK